MRAKLLLSLRVIVAPAPPRQSVPPNGRSLAAESKLELACAAAKLRASRCVSGQDRHRYPGDGMPQSAPVRRGEARRPCATPASRPQ